MMSSSDDTQPNPDAVPLDTLPLSAAMGVLLADRHQVCTALSAAQAGLTETARLAGAALASGGRIFLLADATVLHVVETAAMEHVAAFALPATALLAGDFTLASATGGVEQAGAAAADVGDAAVLLALPASLGRATAAQQRLQARGVGTATLLITDREADSPPPRAVTTIALRAPALRGHEAFGVAPALRAALDVVLILAQRAAGRIYGDLIVDLNTSDQPDLAGRARATVMAATAVGATRAAALLESAGGCVKTAIIVHLLGLSPVAARERLKAAGGQLRSALVVEDRPPCA